MPGHRRSSAPSRIGVLAAGLASSWAILAQADIVTLHNGAKFRGVVTEQTPSGVSIQSDGAVWNFRHEQVAAVEIEAPGRIQERDRTARRAIVPVSTTRSARSVGRNEEGSAEVVVYGTSWCGFCSRARAYLASRGIPFRDRDVEHDPQAREEVSRKCLASGRPFRGSVPVLDVYGEILRGFSAPLVEQALRRHKAG